ncbi:Protein of unknown function (DUF1659) [Desulfosporosinus orientis DSM 765]|uniref:DUF1659 domain-containing protein n=1 Tax=Desulfosporosinus orientis (strain ATCC 19365 / DSM 765 / NCIMB 8382 / VKM B-1628 / Singapore I) TaxID=768706 RepID=G7WJ04_DESOD|nr:DUF1659 domain-containing protein [Desulfosporosinus orientis]AET69729.1 Protein of unknown function (DUF1659) [Desulfosporosinus orientis DSM 765]
MAVTEITLDSILSTKYQTGTTPAGGPVTRKRSLNYVKPTATSQDIYDVAAALSSLSQYPLLNVLLSKNWELIDE